MELNKKLTELRKDKGLTQLELAELLNVSRQAVSRWEVGTASPSLDNLVFLSRLYDVPLDDLIRDRAPEAPAAASPIASADAGKLRSVLAAALLAALILGVGILIGVSLDRGTPKEATSRVDRNSQITVGWLERTPADISDELDWLEAAVKDMQEEEKPSP